MNAAALLFLALVAAEPGTGIIFGTVSSDYDHQPLVGAVVSLYGSGLCNTAWTDSLGHYNLEAMPRQNVVTVTSDNHTYTREYHTLKPNQRLRLDFQLHSKSAEMPVVEVEAVKQCVIDARHNDSVLRLLHGHRFVHVRPWATWVGRSLSPDSSAIRSNNQKMKAAMLAFQRRRGGLFRRPASYFLADTTSPRSHFGHDYIIVSRGRCRLVADETGGRSRSVNAYDIDSLRLVRRPLNDIRPLTAPRWATLPEYVPIELEVFIREKYWTPVIIQHPVAYM